MKENVQLNADRFKGFAKIYDNARPQMPIYVIEVIEKYLKEKPSVVVDLGCGTGLSTAIWQNNCDKVIGIEPSEDMIKIACEKKINNAEFIKAFSHDTNITESSVDVVICSQSFHWMNPPKTLNEVNRILKLHGIFATVDCDWPPICNWEAELAYQELFKAVSQVEENNAEIGDSFEIWAKDNHLSNIKNSGIFQYAREIVFINKEECNAQRFISIALSQGGLQSILKKSPEKILKQIDKFEQKIYNIFGNDKFEIDFCYRMRIGVK